MLLRRVGCILLIAWQVFALNVFLPAHTRGAMTVGKTCGQQTCSQPSCCQSSQSQRDHDKPSPEEQSRCSVCYFAAGLFTPPAVDLNLKPGGLANRLDVPPPAAVVSLDFPLPYHACGPPANNA